MKRFICIHGHFYQPPRENPWLESVDLQESAHPFHDWNERVTAECYAPNARSRILDEQDRIVQMVNNYSKISFNFGPTLLSWLEVNAPSVYGAILQADRESRKNFSGHGSALAQAYHHLIMPLANRRDKVTQVKWGIRDFTHRFQRSPEGMWLPETAVDLKTLEILAQEGIRFTLLAPQQARRVRPLKGGNWTEVNGSKIDTRQPYKLRLPSGRSIALFFYNGSISQAVAFEHLLKKGETFAQRLLSGFSDDGPGTQMAHIATDGETYGHHHKFGDMALAYALDYIDSGNQARLTNYGEFLEKVPPAQEVEIFENTSWSCAHGIERWRSDCGCQTGGDHHWNQAWRTPLREALDWFRDRLAPAFEKKSRRFLKDPWAARDDYCTVVLDRSKEQVEQFMVRHAVRSLSEDEKVTVLKLMELQRHAMLMYTSCGWFFNDLAGIETVQVLQYAERALQLAGELSFEPMEDRFLDILARAKSNQPEHGNGRRIFQRHVKKSLVDPPKLCADFALNAMFERNSERSRIYCYSIAVEDWQDHESGSVRLVLGRARIMSDVTWESSVMCFAVLDQGMYNVKSRVTAYQNEKNYQICLQEMTEAFCAGDLIETRRRMERLFGSKEYSLQDISLDEQKKTLELILVTTLAEYQSVYRQLYESHLPLMRFLKEMDAPTPKAVAAAGEFVLNVGLQHAFEEDELDLERIEKLLQEAKSQGVSLDTTTLEYTLGRKIEEMAERFRDAPYHQRLLEKMTVVVERSGSWPFHVNFWKTQNICYEIYETVYPDRKAEALKGNPEAMEWVNAFQAWAEKLSIKIT